MKVSRHKIIWSSSFSAKTLCDTTDESRHYSWFSRKERKFDIIRIQIWIYESKGIIPGKGSRFRRKGTMRGVRDDTMRACRTMGFGPAEVWKHKAHIISCQPREECIECKVWYYQFPINRTHPPAHFSPNEKFGALWKIGGPLNRDRGRWLNCSDICSRISWRSKKHNHPWTKKIGRQISWQVWQWERTLAQRPFTPFQLLATLPTLYCSNRTREKRTSGHASIKQ